MFYINKLNILAITVSFFTISTSDVYAMENSSDELFDPALYKVRSELRVAEAPQDGVLKPSDNLCVRANTSKQIKETDKKSTKHKAETPEKQKKPVKSSKFFRGVTSLLSNNQNQIKEQKTEIPEDRKVDVMPSEVHHEHAGSQSDVQNQIEEQAPEMLSESGEGAQEPQ